MPSPDTHSFAPRLLAASLALLLVALCIQVLHLFLIPAAWGGILAFVTWPAYVRLRQKLRNRTLLSAIVMTLIISLSLLLPVVWVGLIIESEISALLPTLSRMLAQEHIQLPRFLSELPWLGSSLQHYLDQLQQQPELLRQKLSTLAQDSGGQLMQLLGGVGRNITKFGFAVLTLFFFYLDGDTFLLQLRQVLLSILGPRTDGYLDAIGATTRAVVYGIVLTAIAQGALAGLGYWGAGLDNPVFLAMLTILVALVPFGTPFAWGGVAIWLALNNQVLAATGLAIWGVVVVSWIDNIIRPLVISSATRIPFILVLFGVLGGLAAFGMIGLFIGPVILAVATAVWREWLEDHPLPTETGGAP